MIFVSPFNYVDTFIFYYVILQLIFLFLIILDFLYFKYIKLRDIIGIKTTLCVVDDDDYDDDEPEDDEE